MRYERLGFVLAVLTAAVTAAVQVSGKVSTPLWIFVLLYAAAFALGVATAWIRLRSTEVDEDRTRREQVQRLLAVSPTEDGSLRRLSAMSPYELGVSPSRYGSTDQRGGDPYVPRDRADAELDHALQVRPFVLLVGDSKAGKSRTAYEAARRLTANGRAHDPRVLVPKGTAALAPLLDGEPPLDLDPAPALLWLDDLAEGDLGDLTPALLDRLERRVRILGTMTAQRYGRIKSSDSESGRSARQALGGATVVRLDSQLTPAEQAAAEAAYPHERFRAGIGEQLVAAAELVDRYDSARHGGEPHAWAVVQVAIDWIRMDIGRPIRRSELARLYPAYLRVIRPTVEPENDLTEHLRWAQEPVGSRIALLQPIPDVAGGETSYEPFDHLVAVADGLHGRKAEPILDETWTQVPDLTTPSECFRAAVSADYRGLPRVAATLWMSVFASGDPERAPTAAYNIGVLLEAQGDLSGARIAYRHAVDPDHPERAPRAANNLGLLLAQEGDLAGARAAYLHAINSGDPEVAPAAANNLGVLLEEQGDLPGARALFHRAMDADDSGVATRAALNLGRLLRRE